LIKLKPNKNAGLSRHNIPSASHCLQHQSDSGSPNSGPADSPQSYCQSTHPYLYFRIRHAFSISRSFASDSLYSQSQLFTDL